MAIYNAVAEQVFGTMGTICWTGQLIPQVWKSWREKATNGLSHWLVLLWGISGAFLGVYAFLQRLNIPLMIQPQLFSFLCFISWGQCQYYGEKRARAVAFFMTLSVMVFFGALEAILVVTIRPIHDKGNNVPTNFFGILAAVLISAALLPQYWEIYKLKEVVGLSILFISIDMIGGVFNDLSLVFKKEFDAIAAASYTLVVVLDGVVLVAALILNPRARRRRRAERAVLEAASVQLSSVTSRSASQPNGSLGMDTLAVNSPTSRPRAHSRLSIRSLTVSPTIMQEEGRHVPQQPIRKA